MKIDVTVKKEIDVVYLQVDAGVRHYEDSIINGEEGNMDNTPCVENSRWCPLIHIETGQIINWDMGVTAEIHYKVCDSGKYSLLDENKEIVITTEGYVPSIMSPKGNWYGDYIIMDVDEDGFIDNWNPSHDYIIDMVNK